ncbi:MAG: tetratricopeptide repeat protein, partial [Gemmatimonadota bacterium]
YAAFDLLGELLRQAGRLAEAVEALQHAADLDPKAVQPRLALIACLDALGRHQEAEAALGAVRALGAGDPALTALIQEVARRRE